MVNLSVKSLKVLVYAISSAKKHNKTLYIPCQLEISISKNVSRFFSFNFSDLKMFNKNRGKNVFGLNTLSY